MEVRKIASIIEEIAPLSVQASYDNAGLILGDPAQEVQKALICLDVTREVLEEAIAEGCDLIISHHPMIFQGLKKINPAQELGAMIYLAIQHKIAIYAAHTNLDQVQQGVNRRLGEQLALQQLRILEPMNDQLRKLVVYVPEAAAEDLKTALFDAGAGKIGTYSDCSFASNGEGTFKASSESNPYVGEKGKRHSEKEQRIEVVYPVWIENKLIAAMLAAHPYECPAYDLLALENSHPEVGSGMIGELEKPMSETDFLDFLKTKLALTTVRHSKPSGKMISKVALCGGSGSFLIRTAKQQGADAFVTGDVKYHEFFESENRLFITDVGHYESEIFTKELLFDVISKKIPKFALRISKINTNSVFYH